MVECAFKVSLKQLSAPVPSLMVANSVSDRLFFFSDGALANFASCFLEGTDTTNHTAAMAAAD